MRSHHVTHMAPHERHQITALRKHTSTALITQHYLSALSQV